jgi:hypothetical protein
MRNASADLDRSQQAGERCGVTLAEVWMEGTSCKLTCVMATGLPNQLLARGSVCQRRKCSSFTECHGAVRRDRPSCTPTQRAAVGGIIILLVGSECGGMACMACMRRMHAVRGNLEAARQAHECEERSREDLHELTAALRRQSAVCGGLRCNGHIYV